MVAVFKSAIARDPEGWAGRGVEQMQSTYVKADQTDASSRRHLHRATAMAVILAREAQDNDAVFAEVARRHELLTGIKLPKRLIHLGVAVLARGANTSEMRAKAGKMGNAVKILSPTQLESVDEIAAYLEQQGGIEGLLKEARQRPALSPTLLLVTCTPEQTDQLRAREGEIVTLRVEVMPADSRGMKPIVLLDIISDAAGDNGSPDDEPGDEHFADPDDEDPFG